MNYKKILSSLLLSVAFSSAMAGSAAMSSFNEDWRFFNGNALEAETTKLNDSEWRQLDLPHDWAIEGPFDVKYNARNGGLPFHGTAWYRKTFTMSPEDAGKVVNIIFDGAMSDSRIWINGEYVGRRPYGYVGFTFDITKHLKFDGSKNLISVKLDPKDLSARWYPGAGLYRNVWMSVNNPVHIPLWGTYITTPTVTDALAVVNVETDVVNKGATEALASVKYTIYDANNKVIGSKTTKLTIPAMGKGSAAAWINVNNPAKWDIDSPNLYSMKSEVTIGGELVDVDETTFGIRSIHFDTDGFYLNGRKVRMNGVCLHHDNGPLGTAQYDRADERKLQIMKDMGVNAIRTSHNPPSPEFLAICDRLGLLVLDEIFDGWKINKTENDYGLFFDEWSEADVTNILMRDRNHPSIVMWSVGNEILEQAKKEDGWRDAKRLANIVRNLDPTRPSTIGFNNYPGPYDNNMAQQLDVVGINYKPLHYGVLREKYPQMILYGSETSSCTSSRGVYHLPIEKYTTHESLQVTSYDIIGPSWAYPPDVEFDAQEKYPFMIGEFIWTGFDYLGEPTPYGGRDNFTNGYWNGHWPSRSSYFGAVDLCGLPKDRFYLYKSHWDADGDPMIHLLPHWNWKGMEGKDIPVYAYTNCEEAELFLNGESLGKRVKGKDLTPIKIKFVRCEDTVFMSKYRLSWDVPYKAGELKVVGYNGGKQVTEETIRTAGKPAGIVLSADRDVITADGKDLSYVTVSIVDKDGNLCPEADNLVNFSVEGAGKLLAVGNGNAATEESFQAPYRKAFSGKCMVILNSNKGGESGAITLKATSKGLSAATITIESK
ncbi:MAG: glycoside hydrolase family 2 TIM barrel-domain containing protein [Rikenellaceae bacterium]